MIFSITAGLLLMVGACHKSADVNTGNVPDNLTITATVNADKSGSVDFVAAASNAVSYEFDFGNGVYQQSATGKVAYLYPSGGNYKVTVTAKSSGGQMRSASENVQVDIIAQGKLVWSDEFNTDGAPDPSKWGYNIGTGDNGWGNAELQYYTNRPENAVVQGGMLKIRARKENYNGSTFTSARLLTKGKFDFKYGRVEVSAKMPAGIGTWPAIWMLGADIDSNPWPACGEIDIMEHLGRDLNNIYATLHYPGRSGANANGNTKKIADATTAFHKYTLDWSATAVKMYVDEQLIHSVPNSAAIPFNHRFFLLINMAIGGNFGGAVDGALTGAEFQIDYIRVYQ